MARGRPQYAVVKLPPSADIGTLFMILFENGYSEFKLVNDLSEACGCGTSGAQDGIEGDTDSEPRPSPSILQTTTMNNHHGTSSTSTTTVAQRGTGQVSQSQTSGGTSRGGGGTSVANMTVKKEMEDVSDVACSSLLSLPTLMQQLNGESPSPPMGSPHSSNGNDGKSVGGDMGYQMDNSAMDESDPKLNASAASDSAIDVEYNESGQMGSDETLAHLVSALFPSTSVKPDGDEPLILETILLREKDKQLSDRRRSLGSVIERLHSNGASPSLETRLKKNSEWTYKGEWKCRKCGSLVNPKHRTAQKLLRHMVSHGPRAWSCSACNSKFGLHTSFVSHNKSVHNGEADPISLRNATLEAMWFDLAHECFPDFVDQIHSCIKKTTHV